MPPLPEGLPMSQVRGWRSLTGALAAVLVLLAATVQASQAKRDGMITFDNAAGIHAVNPDGSGRRTLVARAGARQPVWSPNGRRLAYEQHFGKRKDLSAKTRIVYAKANGKGRRMVAKGNSPAWLNNREITYFPRVQHGGEVMAVNVRTGKRRKLTNRGSTALSPNRRHMVYRDIEQLVITTRGGAEVKRFPTRFLFWTMQPTWLDNRHIQYSCARPGKDRSGQLCAVNVRTGKRTIRGRQNRWETSAVRSPSGRFIAWSAVDGLYRTNARGKKLRVLVPNLSKAGSTNPMNVSWQPKAHTRVADRQKRG